MRINDRGAEPVRGARPAEASPTRADVVQISAAGRERAARGGVGPELTPRRIAEVRRHILEGAYGSAEVVGRLAEDLLRSGDL